MNKRKESERIREREVQCSTSELRSFPVEWMMLSSRLTHPPWQGQRYNRSSNKHDRYIRLNLCYGDAGMRFTSFPNKQQRSHSKDTAANTTADQPVRNHQCVLLNQCVKSKRIHTMVIQRECESIRCRGEGERVVSKLDDCF